MAVSNTYAGTTMALVDALPATLDQVGYEALSFEAGECALHMVPSLMREWATVSEPLVCADTNTDIKGSSKWSEMTFKLSIKPGDPAQAIYRSLENSRTGVGSFRIVLPGQQGTLYFTAQVKKFPYMDGGGQDDIITAEVVLLIQSNPVPVAAV